MFLYKKYKILNYDFDFLIIIFFIYYEYLNFIMNFFYFIFFCIIIYSLTSPFSKNCWYFYNINWRYEDWRKTWERKINSNPPWYFHVTHGLYSSGFFSSTVLEIEASLSLEAMIDRRIVENGTSSMSRNDSERGEKNEK